MTLCVIGDDLAAGIGDARGMGWVGRVVARTNQPPPVYTLAVPGETTSELGMRWASECRLRFDGQDDRLVIALGAHDLTRAISLARSRLNLANVLDDAASARIQTFVVGPPPRIDLPLELQAELSAAFADVCQRRQVPYAETFTPLQSHEKWHSDLNASNGVLPGQIGYGLLAWLVLHNGWHDWIGSAPRD